MTLWGFSLREKNQAKTNLSDVEGEIIQVERIKRMSAKLKLDNGLEIIYNDIVDFYPFNWASNHPIFELDPKSKVSAKVHFKNERQKIVEGCTLVVNGEGFYSYEDYKDDLSKDEISMVIIYITLPLFWIICMMVFALGFKVQKD